MLAMMALASAYTTPAPLVSAVSRFASPVKMSFVDALEGKSVEAGNTVWDPLGFTEFVNDETMMWFRAAELKHGRVCMLASVGYLAGAAGLTFPGEIAKGVSFASCNTEGVFNAWGKVPEAGKLQIVLLIFLLEVASESKKPHYLKGGVPGKIDQLPFDGIEGLWAPKIKFWDPLGFMGALTEEQKATKRLAELKNGRLAMLGLVSFLIAHNLPGSVPLLKGLNF
mmetsp:Transcript_52774/g.87656  ORF Transcript_52774/g.87656 Transcript_52774/m.87656 type:complete len:225 (+) Transcript_52774:38-712(+)|eukprot:CAMPEP_0119310766 /NCGR_PEP_ID=MMETSP1333-20130426/20038_1 /TAXON_ID=418940 /ORGANISM="Scyphosphaera apsteinii, Strain RCC1455" /LENGTH=224 /DNA_ID=CAMNT_0007315009 /DNA_START=28 /DNA_END=702 /DNA_ORIENTATION=+